MKIILKNVDWLSFPKKIIVFLESKIFAVFKLNTTINPDLVKKFYKRHYHNLNYKVMDGSYINYISQCLPLLDEDLLGQVEVVDICSGSFSFYKLLDIRGRYPFFIIFRLFRIRVASPYCKTVKLVTSS